MNDTTKTFLTIGARRTALYVLTAAVFFLVFIYVGDFSFRQSAVLAFIVASLRRLVSYAGAKPALRFRPYLVQMHPNWYQILSDYKLIKSAEEWQTIHAAWQESAQSKQSGWRGWIWYSVLSDSADAERTLIYLNHYQRFASEVDFEEELRTLEITRASGLVEYAPRLFVKWSADGTDLGLKVPDDWWEEMKSHSPKPIDEYHEYHFGSVRLTLARIPHQEFVPYWQPVEYNQKRAARNHAVRDQQRQRLGWVRTNDDIPGLPRWPETIEHKYFRVHHQEV